MAYIVMAYIVMAYIVMAYIVMASIVMAYIVMAVKGFIKGVEQRLLVPDILMAYIVMAYTVMAYIVMAVKGFIKGGGLNAHQKCFFYLPATATADQRPGPASAAAPTASPCLPWPYRP